MGNISLTLSPPPQSPKGLPASATTGKKSLASCPWSGKTMAAYGALKIFKEKLKKPTCPMRTVEGVDAER